MIQKVNPKKIFFKYKCLDCNQEIHMPISEATEVGDPYCPNSEEHLVQYKYTYMVLEKDKLPPKKMRTKNTILNATQIAMQQERKARERRVTI